jgi:hypothetical protein
MYVSLLFSANYLYDAAFSLPPNHAEATCEAAIDRVF